MEVTMKHRINESIVILFVLILLDGCATMQSRWKESDSENTIEAYEEFLYLHPKGQFSDEARSRLDSLYFRKAETSNLLENYEDYLRYCQNGKFVGKFVNEAKIKHEELCFHKAEETHLLEDYVYYLKCYPNGRFSSEARLSHEELYYKKALDENTINSYLDLLTQYPDGRYANEIRTKLKNLTDAIKTVRVEIANCKLKEMNEKNLNFEEVVKAYLEYAGLKISSADSQNYDATMKISICQELLNSQYDRQGLLIAYDIGHVVGIILADRSRSIYEYSTGEPACRARIYVHDGKATLFSGFKAPYVEAYYPYYIDRLEDVITETWDVKPLASALEDEDQKVRYKAAIALGKIKDLRFIMLLNNLRKDPDINVRSSADWAFKEIKNDLGSIGPLMSSLRIAESETYLTDKIIEAIKKLTGQDFTHNSSKLQLWMKDKIKNDPSTIERIMTYLRTQRNNKIADKIEALKIVTSQDFGYDLEKWQSWWENKKNPCKDKNKLRVINNTSELAFVKIKDMRLGIFVEQHSIDVGQEYTFCLHSGSYKEYVRFGNSPDSYRYSKGEGFTITAPNAKLVEMKLTLQTTLEDNYASKSCTPEEFEK
jgi:hypothetical protein